MKKDPNHNRIFDKEPQVFYKPGPKAGRDHGIHGQAMADEYYPEESGNAVFDEDKLEKTLMHKGEIQRQDTMRYKQAKASLKGAAGQNLFSGLSLYISNVS